MYNTCMNKVACRVVPLQCNSVPFHAHYLGHLSLSVKLGECENEIIVVVDENLFSVSDLHSLVLDFSPTFTT